MRSLVTMDMLLVSLITLLAAVLVIWANLAMGRARHKYGVKPPAMTGHPAFERASRAQANTLENVVPFLIGLWLCALLFSPFAAAILGFVWLVARVIFSVAYYNESSLRSPLFGVSILATFLLLIGGFIGVVQALLLVH